MKSQITESLHPYLINLPQNLFVALKLRAAVTNMSVKDLIIDSVEDKLSKDIGKKMTAKKLNKNTKQDLAFMAASSKVFAEEWSSQADEKAFAHLQKHLKKTKKSKK